MIPQYDLAPFDDDDEFEPVLDSYDWEEFEAEVRRDLDGDYYRELLHSAG